MYLVNGNDIIERCNKKVSKGDYILQGQTICQVQQVKYEKADHKNFDDCPRHVFISCEKANGQSPVGTRSRVETNEFINLTYMNSIWLKKIIASIELSSLKAEEREESVSCLKIALDYIERREKFEKEMVDIAAHQICRSDNWPETLSEWKLTHNVRIMSPYQAKRFARSVKKT